MLQNVARCKVVLGRGRVLLLVYLCGGRTETQEKGGEGEEEGRAHSITIPPATDVTCSDLTWPGGEVNLLCNSTFLLSC